MSKNSNWIKKRDGSDKKKIFKSLLQNFFLKWYKKFEIWIGYRIFLLMKIKIGFLILLQIFGVIESIHWLKTKRLAANRPEITWSMGFLLSSFCEDIKNCRILGGTIPQSLIEVVLVGEDVFFACIYAKAHWKLANF